jgi:hypothetical protein
MSPELCLCGHELRAHRHVNDRCEREGCRCDRFRAAAHHLQGVYDLNVARRALKARSGAALLERPRGQ